MNTVGWGNRKGWIRTAIVFVVVGSVLSLSSCSKNKSTNPTGGNSGGDFSMVGVGFSVLDSNVFQSTILQCDMLWDGKVVASANFSQASVQATLAAALVPPDNPVKKGQHTILVKMVNQTSSPTSYILFGQVQTYEGAVTKTYETGENGDLTRSLATGESFSWTINLQ